MQKKSNGWPPERRKKQAENIRKTRPWEKSTGPKTAEGKTICADNALKHGHRSKESIRFTKESTAQNKALMAQLTMLEVML